jgi:hypothetical protein
MHTLNNNDDGDMADVVNNENEPRIRRFKRPEVYVLVLMLFVGLLGAGIILAGRTWMKNPGEPILEVAEGGDLFAGFSKLIISPDHINDNFDLRPDKYDSLGAEADSAFILKSKEKISSQMIKDNLKLYPELDFEIQEISEMEWRIVPLKPLEPNMLVKASLDTSYTDVSGQERAREFSWAYQIKDSFKVLHAIPRDTGRDVPVNTGIEFTFSHDNYYDHAKYFSIEPSVEGVFEKHGRTLVFVPKEPLSSGTIYTATVKAGLPLDNSDDKLNEDYSVRFETRPQPEKENPGYYFSLQNIIVNASPKDIPMFFLYARGVQDGRLSAGLFSFAGENEFIKSLEGRNKNPWWSYSSERYIENTDKLQKLKDFSLEIKKADNKQYIELPEFLPPGFYLLELSYEDFKRQIWLQVSGLSAYMNISKTDTLVWVNSLETGTVVAGAKASIVGEAAEAITDQKGAASFKTPAILLSEEERRKENKMVFLNVEHRGEILIMPASQNFTRWYYGYESSQAGEDYWNYLYSDRPRYQPDDTIKFFGFLKDREDKKISETVKVALYKEGYVDYYYRPVKIMEKEIVLSDSHIFDGEFEIRNIRPDYYTLELTIGNRSVKRKGISIRPYVKPAYQLTLTPDKNKAFAGETVKLKAAASFFEGTPVPGLKLIFKTFKGEEKVITDEKGEIDLELKKDYFDCQSEYRCWPDSQYLSIRPEDGELAEITANTYINFYGPEAYLESKTSYPAEGKAKVEFIANKIELANEPGDHRTTEIIKQPYAGAVIKGDVIRTTYTKKETGTRYDFINKKSYKTYTYIRNESKVDEISAITDNEGKYVYERQVEPDTSYSLKLKIQDAKGRYDNYSTYLYYYNGRNLYQYDNNWNYYHLEKTGDKTSFAPGERVEARFLNNEDPMPAGKGKFLFMQLQNGLQEFAVADESLYVFDFEAEDIPNINLEAVYFDGRNYQKTRSGYWGFLPINYDYAERELDIAVKADKAKYKPGEKVDLKIEVKDKNGRPKKAAVNLNLVDEAYYAIAEDFASPLSAIYTPVSAGSLYTAETRMAESQDSVQAEKGGCFAAGTMILLADGTEKPIEQIKRGDRVASFSDPLERRLVSGEVTETWRHTVPGYLIINGDIKVTREHQMYSNGRFIDAGLLKPGDWLLRHNSEKVEIFSIREVFETIEVFNFRVDPQHTYFAAGFYVHNQEKGGGAREVFTDAALFLTVETDSQGRAETTFTLPDNITSWRVTSQAVSADLYAGATTAKIPVSLPVFADVVVGHEYLTVDKPMAKLRAYGDALSQNDKAVFGIIAPGLGVKDAVEISGMAFLPSYFSLPKLTLGRHDITYSLKTSKGVDAVKLPVSVVGSRLEALEAREEILSTATVIKPEGDLPLTIVLSDKGQNSLYRPLQSLSWRGGDRVDQAYIRGLSRKLLNQYYSEDFKIENFNAYNYQLDSGGITLLPYSGAELELSARIAGVNRDFDEISMAQYFFKILENKKSNQEEITFALYGLAALKEPVLPRIQTWLGRETLSIKEKLYLAQALYDLGAGELSRQLYYEIINDSARIKKPYAVIIVDGPQDEVFRATMLAAVLAASLRAPEAEGLWKYVEDNQFLYGRNKNSENIFNIEKYKFIANTLPLLKPSPAEVAYEAGGRKQEVKLTGGQTHAFFVQPQEVGSVKFTSVKGEVGLSTRFVSPFDPSKAERDPSLSITREYFVNGKKTEYFKENDQVEVRINLGFGAAAIAGDYQITDVLPSGLAPVTSHRFGYYGDCAFRYPYNIDGQLVKFRVNRHWNKKCGHFIRYLARVKSKGEYLAEPAIIQSFVNPELVNYSREESIKIE